MDLDETKEIVLRRLREKGRITNSELLDVCGGDERLRDRLKEELILDDLAEDKKGAGLIFVGAQARTTPEEPTAAGTTSSAGPRDVFISYSHQNWREADDIVHQLEALGISIWIDHRKIGAAAWPDKISLAIDACTVFAILCSEHSFASDDVKNECALANHFKRHRVPLHLRRPPLEYPRGIDYFLQRWNAIVVARRPPHEWLYELATGLEEERDERVQRLGRRARAGLAALPQPAGSLPSVRREVVRPAPHRWGRVFRVYVSSTFADLQAERNALHANVFPRLRQLAEAHGAQFQAIDLHWGVGEQNAHDQRQRVMRIVHEEIARCQWESPYLNFISLVGDRYGLCPLPEVIEVEEFELIAAAVSSPSERHLLEEWYRRDDNAVPPVYELLSRPEQPNGWAEWARVEARLGSTLNAAVEYVDLVPSARHKYESSALEQEITRGVFTPDSREHVFCFMRSIQGLPDGRTALPYIDLGEDGSPDRRAAQRLARLKDELQSRLGENVRHYRATWTDGELTSDHLDALCEDAYLSLSRVMLAALKREEAVDPLLREIEEHHAFAESRMHILVGAAAVLDSIEAYLRSDAGHPLVLIGEPGADVSTVMAGAALRARGVTLGVVVRFVGATPQSTDGTALLRSICSELARRGGADEVALPADYPGLAAFFREALAKVYPKMPLLVFIDGIDRIHGPARDLRWLPVRVPPAVAIVVSVEPGPLLEVLKRTLPVHCLLRVTPPSLSDAAVLLDALLRGASRTLQSHQRQAVLASCVVAQDAFETAELRAEEARRAETARWTMEIIAYVRQWGFRRDRIERGERVNEPEPAFPAIPATRRMWSDEEIEAGGLRLYLRLVFEEARRWRSFSPLEATRLGASLPEILRTVFQRLSSDHRSSLVSRTMGFLAASRNGLSEPELLDLLSQDATVVEDLRRRSTESPTDRLMPMLTPWLRLRADLDPYLAERMVDGVLLVGFAHHAVREAAAEAYLSGNDAIDRHAALVEYFRMRAAPGDGKWSGDTRALAELPYHLTLAAAWHEIFELLTDFVYLERMASHVGVIDLPDRRGGVVHRYTGIDLVAENLARVLDRMPDGRPATIVRSFLESVRRESHVLRRWPNLLWQQLSNRLQSEERVSELVAAEYRRRVHRESWLRTRPPTQPALVLTLAGHEGPVRGCAVSGDGSLIVSASNDSTIKLWDAATGQDRATLRGHRGWVTACSADVHGTLLLTSSEDRTLRVWDLGPERQREAVLEGHSAGVLSVSVTPDCQRAVSGSADFTLRVWDLESGACLCTLAGHTDEVTSVSVTPDGRRAVSGSWDKTLRVWDLEAGNCLRVLEGHSNAVSSVSVTPDCQRAVSGSADFTLRVWDLESGACLRTLEGHTDEVRGVSMTPDGRLVVSGSLDQTIRIWDIVSGRQLGVLRDPGGPVDSCALSPDGRLVVSGGHDGTLKVWRVDRAHADYGVRHNGGVLDCAFIADGFLLVTSGDDGTLRISDIETGHERATLRGHSGAVLGCVALGKSLIVSCGADGTLRVWDLETGNSLRVLEGHSNAVSSVSVTPNGRRAVSGGEDNTLRVWDLETGNCLRVLEGHSNAVSSVSVTPDGRRAVSGGEDNTLRVWDLESGTCLYTLEGHTSSITSCAFAQDGSLIASAGWDGTVRIWDAQSGNQLAQFEVHGDRVWDCDLSPDGRMVAAASGDCTVRLWDLAGSELGLLPLPAEALSIAFHPSRPLLACGDAGGNVHVVELVGTRFSGQTASAITGS